MLTEEVVGKGCETFITTDFQVLQGWGGVAKKKGDSVDAIGAQDDQGSHSRDVGSEVLEHFGVSRQIAIYSDVDGC